MGGLPFSINADTGELIGLMEYSPDEVGRNLVCPACHQPVTSLYENGRYRFVHEGQHDCRLGAKVGVMLALQAELDKPLIEPINITLPAINIQEEITSPVNPALVLRDAVVWHRPVPPVTIIKGKGGPHFFFRFTDSGTNNLGLYLPPPDKAIEPPDWLADHIKRHMNVGLIWVDYTSLLAALSQQMFTAPSSEATATMLFRLFLAGPDTKGWLYHPRERGIRERLRAALKEQLMSASVVPPPPAHNQPEIPPLPVVNASEPPAEDVATVEILLSVGQIAEMITHDGLDGVDAVLYSPDCQLEIDGGWLVLKHDKAWLIERATSGDWSKRTIRFAGGMRSGRYVPASDILVRSIKAAVGYGNG